MTNYDFMPSLLSFLGFPMPQQPKSPGRDFSPLLRGEKLNSWDDVLFFEFENVRAIRTLNYKYVERKNDQPARELFDLEKDLCDVIGHKDQNTAQRAVMLLAARPSS